MHHANKKGKQNVELKHKSQKVEMVVAFPKNEHFAQMLEWYCGWMKMCYYHQSDPACDQIRDEGGLDPSNHEGFCR